MTKINKITKPLFKEYLYKIKFLLLDPTAYRWSSKHQHLPEVETSERLSCLKFIASHNVKPERTVRISHTWGATLAFFKDENTYRKVLKKYKNTYVVEAYEPAIDNLMQLHESKERHEELRHGLYFKKYIYKISISPIKFGEYEDFHEIVSRAIELSQDNDYHVNSNLRCDYRVFNRDPNTRNSYSMWRVYSICCKDEVDLNFLTLILGDVVRKISKAILIDDLDK